MQEHLALFYCDPMHFEEAIKEDKWIQAMNEEIDAIERNDTWDFVDLLEGKDNIGFK